MTPASVERPASLEALVRSIKSDWTLDVWGVPDRNAAYLASQLVAADEAAQERFVDGSVRLTLETVISLAERSADRARAFVEQLASGGSPQMVVMAWRVLNGVNIGRLQVDVVQAGRFRLEIQLQPDRVGTSEVYESNDANDFGVVRRFGNAKLNGELPLLIGFYATWTPPD